MNSADNEGGAIYLRSVTNANVAQAYIAGNSAGIDGGAIYNIVDSDLTVSQTTFDSDSAKGKGGGIYDGSRSTLNVINSTFFGGSQPEGEGIFVASGSAAVQFTTFVTALVGGLNLSPPPVSLSNSILSDVTCQFVEDDFYNLQFGSIGCPASIKVTDPMLDPMHLLGHGGPTPTIALLPGSPAIGAIPYGNCVDQAGHHVTTDQRGDPRPGDGPTGPCSVGAYEFQAP